MSQLYQWLVFLHVLGVFGFLLGHGASAVVAFALRRERNLARVSALLDLSRGGNMLANIFLLIFLLAGIIAGFMGNWWGQGWIWLALGLLIALAVAMFPLGATPLTRVRDALAALEARSRSGELDAAARQDAEKQVAALLDATHPVLISIVGGGVLAVILWLMLFKPF